MPTVPPQISLSRSDSRLLTLLAEIILADIDCNRSNIGLSDLALSPSEANELMELLEEFIGSKQFHGSAYLVEQASNGHALDDDHAREIFLSWRARLGRARLMSSFHWREYVRRLGVEYVPSGYFSAVESSNTIPMPLTKFMQLEKRLLESFDIHPRVRYVILRFVEAKMTVIKSVREGEAGLRRGSVRDVPQSVLTSLKRQHTNSCGGQVSATQVIAAMTLIADLSVMFTTRDWGVAGTLSTMVGASGATVAQAD